MSHIEVLKKYLEREHLYLHQVEYEPIDSEEIRILIKWNNNLIKEKIDALSHAIKCCEIVAGLPDRNEIEQIINNYCQGVLNKDKVMLIYGKLAQVIHERIGGVK